MRTKSNSTKNFPIGIKISTPWRVAKVVAQPKFCLEVTFIDGLHGHVDMANIVSCKQAGVFAKLNNQSLFNKVYVEYGVVTWPGEIDLAPDAMYEEIKHHGTWIL